MLNELKPNPKNPRLIKKDEFVRLKKKIKEFPEMLEKRPIVYDGDFTVLGGNQRLRALKELVKEGLEVKDSYFKSAKDWSEEQKRKFVILDNIADGEWEWETIANEWTDLPLEEWGLDPTQWETGEVEEDEVPDVLEEADSKYGEVYELGRHRLMCGDATKIEDVEKLMAKKVADMIFTDPPYLMNFEGNVHADGSKSFNASHGGILMDNLGKQEGDDFLYTVFANMFTVCKGAFYVCWYRLGLDYMMRALESHKMRYRALIIWDKGNHTLSNSDYMSRYEPIIYGWVKDHNFYRKPAYDIWSITRTQKNELHPTMKPVELCAKAIRDSSKKGAIVLDLFGGSGSTLIACEQTDRICYMMELDPKYCDVIRKRYEQFKT